MPNKLNTFGCNSLIALINHTGKEIDFLSKKWNNNVLVPRIILSRTINFINEIKIFIKLRNESLRLNYLARREKSSLIKKILYKASQEALSNRSMVNLRIAFQIEHLILRFNPKMLIITHEGHSFERIIFSRSRSVNKNIYCLGYQHAVIFKLQHAVCRNLKSEYNPDKILTSGKIGKNILDTSRKIKNIPIEVIGTNRFLKINKFSNLKIKNKKTCLVLPEGLLSECFILFDFSLECARKFSEIKFIWRLHPGIDFNKHIMNTKRYKNIPKNIIISKNKLGEDFRRSNWALYRGTTTIIQAIFVGLKPIYLELPKEINIDPLNEIGKWHAVVKNITEFNDVIKEKRPKKWNKKNWLKSKNYCDNFFKPLNTKILINTFNKIKQ